MANGRHRLDTEIGSFRALFDAHVAFVWRALARHGVRDEDLEDACQEVFMVVNARHADFEGRSTLRTWIYGIAIRVASSFRRKRARRREQPGSELPEAVSLPDQLEQVAQKQMVELIEVALACLSEQKREVFALYELEGMTMAEVASTLAVPQNTALSRLYAAREEIRSYLKKHGAGPGSTHTASRKVAP